MEETAKDREAALDSSDMYLDDLKKNFGSVMSLDSRNSANRSNKPIASGLAKGPGKIRVQHHDNDKNDSDEEDDDDDDDILGRSGEDLRQSFGKKTGGLA